MRRSWDPLAEEKRKAAIEAIIRFFSTERDEQIGVIAAEDLLEMLLQNVASEIYNRGVEDARRAIKERMESVDIDIDALLRK
jgi:uncharacterized protein (DUF2164 family)